MHAEGHAAIYREALERADAGDLAGYLNLYSDDVVFGGVTPEPLDKAGVVAFHENFYSAFPGAPRASARVARDRRQACRTARAQRPTRGPVPGRPASGNDVQLAITTILTMRDGKCVEPWSTADMLGVLIQVGAVPAPGA